MLRKTESSLPSSNFHADAVAGMKTGCTEQVAYATSHASLLALDYARPGKLRTTGSPESCNFLKKPPFHTIAQKIAAQD